MNEALLLVLDRRDIEVRLEGKALRVHRPEARVERIPLGVLGQVVVHGSPRVSCDVWRALAERNIPAVLLPSRGGGAEAWVGAGLAPSVRLRRQQHHVFQQYQHRWTIAYEIVALKLRAQSSLLAWALGIPESADHPLIHTLMNYLRSLDQAADIPSLMGIEGAAAAAWYGWLAERLPAHWDFTGRNRRPPRDPVNSLFSLGYTLATAEMQRHVISAGLDPALGFLHEVAPARYSLVLDLTEPLRPGVDALVLELLDDRLTPEDFHCNHRDGCRLNKASRGAFYGAWSSHCAQWPTATPISTNSEPQGEANEPNLSLPAQCRRLIRLLTRQLDELDDG